MRKEQQMDDKTVNTLINAELPPSVDNALNNLTDKPSLAIGTTFSDLWYLVFGGFSYLAEKKKIAYTHKLELFRKELDDSIQQIPSEKLIEPSIQVTAQALENSKYCIESDELRKMFTALISNSMNADFSKDVHPSFAEILKQMSPLDAVIIKIFKGSSVTGFPICQYRRLKKPSYQILLDNVFLEHPNTYPPDNSLSISSLSRLGLLYTAYDQWITNEDLYVPFKNHPWHKFLQEQFPEQTVDIQKGLVRLTPLGRSFTQVCVPD